MMIDLVTHVSTLTRIPLSNCFFARAPTSAIQPFAVIRDAGNEPDIHYGGNSATETKRLEIHVFHNLRNFSELHTLVDRLEPLHGFSGTLGNTKISSMIRTNSFFSENNDEGWRWLGLYRVITIS